MKKILLLITLFAATQVVHAQWINSITLVPANPTSADSLRFYIDCSFPSGPCDLDVQTQSAAGNSFYGYAKHCMGMLTVICPAIDSFIFPPASPGNYTFHFSLDAGLAPAPCTPGIVPGQHDSLVFTDSLPAGIPGIPKGIFDLDCNPVTGQVTVILPSYQSQTLLEIFSVDGRLLQSRMLQAQQSQWTLDFPPGVYIARLQDQAVRPVTFVITR